jgi:undecaprenyl diphosphate synthase
MDGNGRWAAQRGLPRLAGHRQGAEAVRRTVEASPGLGIGALTLYAFSSDNWKRPPEEVAGLMDLFSEYLLRQAHELAERGIRFSVVGRRDRLDPALASLIDRAESVTRRGSALHLRVAVDYSARDMLVRAAEICPKPVLRRELSVALGQVQGGGVPAPDVDILIRTGGEQRLSDFLLWESAYAELFFLPVMWPDFTREHLSGVLEQFRRRERRFGAVPSLARPA